MWPPDPKAAAQRGRSATEGREAKRNACSSSWSQEETELWAFWGPGLLALGKGSPKSNSGAGQWKWHLWRAAGWRFPSSTRFVLSWQQQNSHWLCLCRETNPPVPAVSSTACPFRVPGSWDESCVKGRWSPPHRGPDLWQQDYQDC